MSDKLLFWVNKAVECEEENKRLKQRINLLQIAGDEAIKQRNDALRERDEARAENKRLREFLQKKPEPEKAENWDEEVMEPLKNHPNRDKYCYNFDDVYDARKQWYKNMTGKEWQD